MERRDQQSDSRRLVYAVAPARVGSARICTRLAAARVFACAFASMLADGTPVRANDRSQSEVDGPRMLPSMKARPGQREQFETWEQEVQVDRSFTRIARSNDQRSPKTWDVFFDATSGSGKRIETKFEKVRWLFQGDRCLEVRRGSDDRYELRSTHFTPSARCHILAIPEVRENG